MIQKLMPGIRAKLSIFTAFFVTSIVGITSVIYLNQQYDSLTASFRREIMPIRRYTERLVLGLENIVGNLILVEEFRDRLKTKTKELKRYRKKRVRVRKKSWMTRNVLGLLNYVQDDLVDTKDKVSVRYVDTYFSEYITDEKVDDLEEHIKTLMRDNKGNLIDDTLFAEQLQVAGKIVSIRKDLRTLQSDLVEKQAEKKEEASKKKPKLEKLNKQIAEKEKEIEKTSKEMYKLYEELNQKVYSFYFDVHRLQILDLGLNTNLMRVQTFDWESDKANFDTGIFDATSFINTSSTHSHPKILASLKSKVHDRDMLSLAGSFAYDEIEIDGREIEIYYQPILRNEGLVNRAVQVYETARQDENAKPIFAIDVNNTKKLAKIAGELEKRLAVLKKKSKKPSKDEEFRNLYKDYQKLLAQRTKELTGSPVSQADRVWEMGDAQSSKDSFLYLRDKALYEYAILRYEPDSYSYREYLHSAEYRAIEQKRWQTLREWVMEGSSETNIPTFKYKDKEYNVLDGGILARSRSEIEEEMWRIDTTPLFLAKATDKNAKKQTIGLAEELIRENFAGYTRTLVDKSSGLDKIKNDMRNIVYNASGIGTIAIVLAFLFSNYMVRDIRRISLKAERVGQGKLDVIFRTSSRDEIGKLSNTLNHMVIGLQERDKAKNALGRFVNPEIAEMVLKKELKLGGEKKDCVIFFSDIRSFTAISEKLSPEEVVEFLNEYMTEMVRCVNETHGVVDKFIGDAIMATWGAVNKRDDHPENAINAALAMRRALLKFNEGRGGDKKPIIKIGSGLNYGPVVAGQIGSEERLEYTVIGDAVNLASRVEALNKPFGTDILITDDLYQQVKEIFRVEKMQAIKVKGKEEPQVIYAVIGRLDSEEDPKTLQEMRDLLGIETPKAISSGEDKEVKYEILDS
ncbi:MAG: adenylate/guanylate cyclase domain-containing protein [Spirochaetota bacterium]